MSTEEEKQEPSPLPSVQHDNIVDALAAAQAEFTEIKKDKTARIVTKSGATYEYKYADLASVLDATRPHLSRHGLAVSWVYQPGDRAGFGMMVTRVLHRSGSLENPIPVFYDPQAQSVMQSLGSAQTYARRYGLSGLIGVVAEDDDDGAGAGTPPAQASTNNASQGNQQQSGSNQRNNNRSSNSRQQSRGNQTEKSRQPEKTPEKRHAIFDRIDSAQSPEELVDLFGKCIDQWPEKQEFLGAIKNYMAELNRTRVMEAYEYPSVNDNGHTANVVWTDEDRQWVAQELTDKHGRIGQVPEEPAATETSDPQNQPAFPEKGFWLSKLENAHDPATVFALITDAAKDQSFTGDKTKFDAFCEEANDKIDKSTWQESDKSMVRQHLFARITTVEAQQAAEAAGING